jgi:replicative DNA helicase
MKSRILSLKYKPDFVVIDFIQKMSSKKYHGDKVREMEDVAQGISDMTKDLNICTLTLSQLQGAAEKLEPDEVPNMSHFKESQGIPENMDQIWTLHDPDRHNNPYVNNEYVPRSFKMRIEQRFDVSGSICEFKGDMRTCNFYDTPEQEAKDEEARKWQD